MISGLELRETILEIFDELVCIEYQLVLAKSLNKKTEQKNLNKIYKDLTKELDKLIKLDPNFKDYINFSIRTEVRIWPLYVFNKLHNVRSTSREKKSYFISNLSFIKRIFK